MKTVKSELTISLEVFNVPKPLNRDLSRVRPECCAHLFFKDNIYDDSASPSYFASISGPWNRFYSLIKVALINSNYGRYGIRCKVNHHSSPKNQIFNRAIEVFQFGSYLKTLGKLVVCIIVNSSNECKLQLNYYIS